jgi:hypothetical protein
MIDLFGFHMQSHINLGGFHGAGHGFLPEPLTLAEELVIRRFYEQKIQQVSAAFSFPNKIQV